MSPLSSHASLSADRLIAAALEEDLSGIGDFTSRALLAPDVKGIVQVVSRSAGRLSGGIIAARVFERVDPTCRVAALIDDGERLCPGTVVLEARGPVGSLLIAERTALNFLTSLSGIATLTRRFVDACFGTPARILDTRKTLPGWRALAKYAVTCGGGTNHRMGLYDGILIKDNHLGAWTSGRGRPSIAAAIRHARSVSPPGLPVEVEVDTLSQLEDALQGGPDIVLLDNMSPDLLLEAVHLRDRSAPQVQLEASGGVTLATVAEIAATGVDRISVGALTHSAPALDLGFDWIRREIP